MDLMECLEISILKFYCSLSLSLSLSPSLSLDCIALLLIRIVDLGFIHEAVVCTLKNERGVGTCVRICV